MLAPRSRDRFFLPAVAALAFLALAAPGRTLAGTETIRCATFDFPPYGMHVEETGKSGLYSDINDAIARRAGFRAEDRLMPLRRVMRDLIAGKIECATFFQSDFIREKVDHVGEVIPSVRSVTIPRRGTNITRLEDLHGVTLAMPRGAFRWHPVSQDPKISRTLTKDYEAAVRLFAAGRAEAVAGTSLNLYHYFDTLSVPVHMLGVPYVFAEQSVWLHCNKESLDATKKAALRRAITELHEDRTIIGLVEKYAPLIPSAPVTKHLK